MKTPNEHHSIFFRVVSSSSFKILVDIWVETNKKLDFLLQYLEVKINVSKDHRLARQLSKNSLGDTDCHGEIFANETLHGRGDAEKEAESQFLASGERRVRVEPYSLSIANIMFIWVL